ncbi:hypothetical protein BGZ61DRAFT_544006 [Ilyonectria robusta]|uniref:uncharacterized protein n=1 Tax=Ilyonectria robusta TaxID=1079257 RepID=UPI001E8E8BA6|nr:uncharacterized protein BGZ61DRAFT_544006 [Ilyonectria robusta]KAH8737806.1 hypothetical protein BGZ61DRAFT_544006 [Ilyonectria robusta]
MCFFPRWWGRGRAVISHGRDQDAVVRGRWQGRRHDGCNQVLPFTQGWNKSATEFGTFITNVDSDGSDGNALDQRDHGGIGERGWPENWDAWCKLKSVGPRDGGFALEKAPASARQRDGSQSGGRQKKKKGLSGVGVVVRVPSSPIKSQSVLEQRVTRGLHFEAGEWVSRSASRPSSTSRATRAGQAPAQAPAQAPVECGVGPLEGTGQPAGAPEMALAKQEEIRRAQRGKPLACWQSRAACIKIQHTHIECPACPPPRFSHLATGTAAAPATGAPAPPQLQTHPADQPANQPTPNQSSQRRLPRTRIPRLSTFFPFAFICSLSFSKPFPTQARAPASSLTLHRAVPLHCSSRAATPVLQPPCTSGIPSRHASQTGPNPPARQLPQPGQPGRIQQITSPPDTISIRFVFRPLDRIESRWVALNRLASPRLPRHTTSSRFQSPVDSAACT